jgi:hypothetical protein
VCEREFLLVLSSVTSTPQWIHQPRLRDVREDGRVFTRSLLILYGSLKLLRLRDVCDGGRAE